MYKLQNISKISITLSYRFYLIWSYDIDAYNYALIIVHQYNIWDGFSLGKHINIYWPFFG